MEEIKDIVNSIVRGCAQAGCQVPDVLAAFIARTVVEGNASSFVLDRNMTPEKVQDVILQSIEKLLERDCPALETMKMQVDYDTAFLKDDNEAQKILRARSKMISSHKMGIVEVEMGNANDFEALTTLYRKIFRFLLDFTPNSRSQDRSMEREVAAALESVFPRVGLKAFVQLTFDEKSAQLMELAKIVLGIRLFNRDQGRGGEGLDTMDKSSSQLVTAMMMDIDREVEFFSDACAKYQTAIVRGHLQKQSQARLDDDKNTMFGSTKQGNAGKIIVNDCLIDRWSDELSNRRQYLGFLRTLQEEVHSLHDKISHFCDTIQLELTNIKTLVSNKTSVAKEVVYPRFDSLGTVWTQLFEEVVILTARSNTFRALCKYRLSFNPTLLETFYNENTASNDDMMTMESNRKDPVEDKQSYEFKIEDLIDGMDESSKLVDPLDFSSGQDVTAASGATLLSVYNTPDFMLLPLELQGYCPWTVVNARGLLVPGKPALGVVRYDNLYFVCDNESALKAFMTNPELYLTRIKERVYKNPEYIHLLRLQRWFPKASIARLLEQSDIDPRVLGGKPATRDVGTGTPTHFIECYIDINYHWNEWELRRRALKLVNLKNCVTKAQQTDNSNFRRDTETQVYEGRDRHTQTKRDKGTNPPLVTTFVAGLRGKLDSDAKAVSKYIRKDGKDFSAGSKGCENLKLPRIITMKMDL